MQTRSGWVFFLTLFGLGLAARQFPQHILTYPVKPAPKGLEKTKKPGTRSAQVFFLSLFGLGLSEANSRIFEEDSAKLIPALTLPPHSSSVQRLIEIRVQTPWFRPSTSESMLFGAGCIIRDTTSSPAFNSPWCFNK